MGKLIQLASTFVRPADNTAYSAGDEISNHATAGSVVRSTFDLTGYGRGRILRAGVDITPASGNLVITALDFDLLIFKTSDVPAAVGDNVTHPISAAVRRLAIGQFRFDADGWTNQLGALTAGTSGYQKVPNTLSLALATPALVHSDGSNFTFDGSALSTAGRQLTAVLQVLAAWTPTGVVNTFGIVLDIEAE